ncbi:hypothetical protein Tco_1269435, partial [Tanacetum coccineum]
KKLAEEKDLTGKKIKKERDPGKLKRPPTALFLFIKKLAEEKEPTGKKIKKRGDLGQAKKAHHLANIISCFM